MMKPFDLAAAKAGAAVCTRSKKPVEIITTNGRVGKFPILAYVGSSVRVRSFSANGQYGYKYESADDLMMRDDDYAEKLARGEYGNHIEDKVEKVDREHLRRELSEKIMVAMIRELAGKSPHSTSSNITVYEAMAADAVSYADALLEELEKKK
jgi:hypothetical protein